MEHSNSGDPLHVSRRAASHLAKIQRFDGNHYRTVFYGPEQKCRLFRIFLVVQWAMKYRFSRTSEDFVKRSHFS